MKYKVLFDRGYTFDNLKDAQHFAERVFKTTGIVVGIVQVKA